MTAYDRLADLALDVAAWDLHRQSRETPAFERVTTTFRARGPDATGRGEDVTYEADDHDALAADPPDLPTGRFTFEEFSAALDGVDLFAAPPDRAVFRNYRRWAVESAALDLALRQADASLGGALGRDYEPVRFVVSPSLGDPPTTDRVERVLDANPTAEFKLDPTPGWDEALVADLAALDRVRVLDLKGLYDDPEVAAAPDPDLYERVLAGFPDAVIEDPRLTPATGPLFEGEEDRVSWDVPVHGLADLGDLPFEPRWLNVKPSRFGTVESLLETVEHAREADVSLYGGGQFELGVGREHVQALASLFYPDGPNDVAPTAYNDADMDGDLPASPLEPPADPQGLSFASAE